MGGGEGVRVPTGRWLEDEGEGGEGGVDNRECRGHLRGFSGNKVVEGEGRVLMPTQLI